jgi:hypothetical protein
MKIQGEVFEWFERKDILFGNPEDIINKHVEKQKALILPKKSQLGSALKPEMNGLIARRNTRMIEVNGGG